jgi:hypothetical protein
MSILNFPPNPTTGTTYTVVNATYVWNGYAWLKSNNGDQTFSNLTATTSLTVGGQGVITTATTSTVHFLNTTNSTSTTTGAVIIDGGLAVGEDVWVGGRLYSESLQIADTVFDSTAVETTTTFTTIIDQYSAATYRSSKYLVQIDDGTDSTATFQVTELLLIVTNTGTVLATEYGKVTSDGDMGEFSANVLNDNIVRLYFTPYVATDKTIKVLRTAMTR